MAGKLADFARNEIVSSGHHFEVDPHTPTAEARALNVMLSGTVLVDYDVTLTESDGSIHSLVVRIEFPDEVRSMLEASTWGRGLTILEALSRLGAEFLQQNAAAGLLRFARWESTSEVSLRPPTFHVPLAYVRSSLATVFASTV